MIVSRHMLPYGFPDMSLRLIDRWNSLSEPFVQNCKSVGFTDDGSLQTLVFKGQWFHNSLVVGTSGPLFVY